MAGRGDCDNFAADISRWGNLLTVMGTGALSQAVENKKPLIYA
jgi:hypothetical protein